MQLYKQGLQWLKREICGLIRRITFDGSLYVVNLTVRRSLGLYQVVFVYTFDERRCLALYCIVNVIFRWHEHRNQCRKCISEVAKLQYHIITVFGIEMRQIFITRLLTLTRL